MSPLVAVSQHLAAAEWGFLVRFFARAINICDCRGSSHAREVTPHIRSLFSYCPRRLSVVQKRLREFLLV